MSENIPYIIAENGYYYVAYKEKVKVPEIVVSSKGVANGLSEEYNDGWDFGPDSYSPTSTSAIPYTGTAGIMEAVNYVYVKGGGRVFLRNGTYKLSVTTLTQGQNMQAAILIPPTVATNPIIPIIIEGESSLLSIYESGDTSIPPQLPDEAGGVIIDGSGLPNNFNNNDTPSAIIGADRYTPPSGGLPLSATEVTIKNIYVIAPSNPSYSGGIHLYNSQSAIVKNCIVGVITDSSGNISQPLNNGSLYPTAIIMPQNLNNGRSVVNNIMAFGWFVGMSIDTHFIGDGIFIAFCSLGLLRGGSSHASYIGYLNIENCNYIFQSNYGITRISMLDMQYVNDSSIWSNYNGLFFSTPSHNVYVEDIHIVEVITGIQPFSSALIGSVNPSPYLHIKYFSTGLTVPSTPSVPASGSTSQNIYPYSVKVYVNGGALTEIQITIGSTSYTVYSNSTASAVYEGFTLPAGASITLTYTTAPTWSWVPE